MPPYLRAFLFDPSQPSDKLADNVFSSWNDGEAVCIIPVNQPQTLIDQSIVKCDPNEVIDTDGNVHVRDLAIVETPDLACVVLTSGTTSNPKPVELSFSSMKNSVDALYRMSDLDSSDTWLCCLPPYYIAGLAIFARSFSSGSRLVFHESFDVMRVQETLQAENIAAISLVSSQLEKLLRSDVDLSSLKTVLVGGSSISKDLIDECRQKKIPLHKTYGMTETWGGICHDGKLFENTQARINQEGIIEISTTSLMSGYRHDQRATFSAVTSDGWFITRDRGELHDGKLSVLGRSDDIINSGGIKVDPEALEAALAQQLDGADYAVCSTPHDVLGECVTLCITPDNSIILKQVRTLLANTVPSTQLPMRLANVESIPRTPSGKVQRKTLSEMCTIVEEHS